MCALGRRSAPARIEARLGLLNGALIGLALAAGAWGLSALAARGTLSPAWYGSLLLGLVASMLVGSLAGWLATAGGKAFLSLVIWCGAALAITWIIGHLAYEGSTLAAWLLDGRFRGLPVYPYIPAALVRQVMAGFFVLLLLAILGLFQPYRLEGIAAALTADRRLTGQAWFLLVLPLPLVFGAGLIADNLVNQPLRRSVAIVDQVFRTGRTYEGDLFRLSLESGVNYNAIAGVRERMSPRYTLSIGEIELGAAATVFVVAHFANGSWINCRVVADQLSFCWDASPPYERGLPALLAGQTVAECPECTVVVDAAAQAFLAGQTPYSEPPQMRRLAQQGSYVWMRAASSTGDADVDCLLRGISPVRLVECRAVAKAAGSAVAPENAIEGTGTRSGRMPGLMALAPPERTPEPEPQAGMATPDRMGARMGMATPDRLTAPPTVDPPTQADLGAQAYWFRCMVCHGDRGQGLTDEWRSAWDPTHQDCWQSRCHASNHPPEGFQLPRYAPPLIGPGTLSRHVTLADLHSYLSAFMPWQAPGSLPEEEYWQLAAYLARANGAAVSDADLTPNVATRVLLHSLDTPTAAAAGSEKTPSAWPIVASSVLPLALVVFVYVRLRRR